MTTPRALPIALTIAGSDSGGGAGIQADLKVFNALRVHGTTAITCITCQNPRGVRAVQTIRPDIVLRQIEAVLEELPPAAIKTGMLYSAPILRAVIGLLRSAQCPPLIVDPVMVATSGSQLLKTSAIRVLRSDLLPLATLVTPNLDEAALLTGKALSTPEDLRAAARTIHDEAGCAVLVKGGHLKGLREAVDVFWDGSTELLLTAPFIRGVSTHGTGCTYSGAITAYMALGNSLTAAVTKAKDYVTNAIGGSRYAGQHWVLGTNKKS